MSSNRPTSLLQKYNIPLDHLSYEYVDDCKNVRELEKILKILRSGEEGTYPQLITHAEIRLNQLNPKSRALRKEEAALNASSLGKEEWEDVSTQLKNWSESVLQVDGSLNEEKALVMETSDDMPIRGSNEVSRDMLIVEMDNNSNTKKSEVANDAPASRVSVQRRTKHRSFADWDKFDADEELLRLETDEERRSETKERDVKREKEWENMRERNLKESRFNKSLLSRKLPSMKQPMSKTEKLEKAMREKIKGNEYFKAQDYRGALRFFTNSISISPTLVVYNNRALSFFRLHCFNECIEDCDAALRMDPDNVKAYYRRACAKRELGEDREAYDDVMAALRRDQNNVDALKLAHQLVAVSHGSFADPASRRMLITDVRSLKEEAPAWTGDHPDCLSGGSVSDLPESIEVAPRYHVNKWGLASKMCNCAGVPKWLRNQPAESGDGDKICDDLKNRCRITEIEPKRADTEAKAVEDHEFKKNKWEDVKTGCKITEIDPKQADTEAMKTEEAAEDQEFKKKTWEDVKRPCEITEIVDVDVDRLSRIDEDMKKVTDSGTKYADVNDYECNKSSKMWPGARKRCTVTEVTENDEKTLKELCEIYDDIVEQEVTAKSGEMKTEECNVEAEKGEREVQTTESFQQVLVKTKETGNETKACGDGSSSNYSNAINDSSFFLLTWSTLRDPDCLHHAKVLNSIRPQDLPRAIGNALDDSMLSTLLTCLDKHWTLFTPDLRLEYLEQISRLERFSFVHLFMSDKDKLAVKNIMELLHDQGTEVSHTLRAVFEV